MNEYYKMNLKKYLASKINIASYEETIKENYNDICLNGYSLENNIYLDKMDDSDLKYLKLLFSNNEINNEKIFNFIEKTYSKVLRYKLSDNIKIYYDNFVDDINNFVDDGTLVWKIKYKEKINVDIKEQLKKINSLESLIKRYDEEMSNVLNIKVKTFLVPVFVEE